MSVTEGDERRGHLVERNRSRDAEIDSRESRRGRQGYDESVDAGAHGQQSVEQTPQRADGERDGNRDRERKTVKLHRRAEQYGYQAAERSDGYVHLTDAES